jgi:diguanylate cyclase (GGDEF)-like protein
VARTAPSAAYLTVAVWLLFPLCRPQIDDKTGVWRRRRGRQGARSSARLFATYAIAGLVPVAALGAVLIRGVQSDAARQVTDQGRAQAAVIAEMAVAPALVGGELDDGLTTRERDRLQEATDLALFHGSLYRMRLRTFTGQVVFADDGSTAGGIAAGDPAFRAAAVGDTAVAVVTDPDAPGDQAIRVLQPVVASATGEAIGVLELYLPYQALAVALHRQIKQTYWRLGGVLGVIYLVLGLIAWSTTRSLRRYADQQQYEAMHDGLTGLPNREEFRNRAAQALAGARRDDGRGAIVLVDLNRFKEVNDTLGHHAGDELLQVVAQRLLPGLRGGDTLARLGGDEFAMILPGLEAADVLPRMHRLREELTREAVIEGVPLNVEASFGVALYPEHGDDVEELLRRADAAMYQSKRGATDVVLYAGGGVASPTQWLVVQAELRHALQRDELILVYQPKVDLTHGSVDGTIDGVEALVRWQHPERGLLPPSEFLPAAELSGVIEPLTAWVLRRALADQARWTADGRPWAVSVNISARNLETPGFAEFVAGLLADYRVPAESLLLEVTETALAGDAETAAQAVRDLAARGVGISVDDFGMGYTSLSQLRSLPIAEIKIDRAFVSDLLTEPESRAIVRSVIELAHGLGSKVTAEGVETAEVADWLAAAGCDTAQGYFYSRPVPWPDISPHEISQPEMRQHVVEGVNR